MAYVYISFGYVVLYFSHVIFKFIADFVNVENKISAAFNMQIAFVFEDKTAGYIYACQRADCGQSDYKYFKNLINDNKYPL